MQAKNSKTTMPMYIDDVDTVHTLVTQAGAIVAAMTHALIEATEGGGRTGTLSETCVRGNLWAASDLLRQAEAVLENPRADDDTESPSPVELPGSVEVVPQQSRATRNDGDRLPDRALRKLEDMERDYLSVQQSVSAVRSFADELHDASYQDEPPELFSEFAGIRVQAISRLAQLALNDIERLDTRARELRGLPDPMGEALKAAS